ncbi:MAG: TetR/AcrR family transcriptional regulator [Hyphomonadaceae bacterium]|nr:TetR/AcrR family transcriptional regulator [Hyphomonadaceae bacterium]
MLDQTTPRGRILSAALQCAAGKSWADVTLLDIAEAAGLPIGDLRGQFNTKDDIIAGLLRAVDDEVLKRAPRRAEGQERRDVLFDILMTRFDVLGPHKAALKSIHASGPADVALARPFLSSMHWMLQAAGIDTGGVGGGVRVSGLAMVYASVFRVWLEDDDAGLARTMAALDRRLRRGERTVRNIEQVGSVLQRFATDAPGFLRSVLRGRPKPEPKPGPEAGSP